jgi:lipopolysaccharide export LptBFGC system permease protein LptF
MFDREGEEGGDMFVEIIVSFWGRIAWVAAIVVGAILAVVGGVTHQSVTIVAGVGFAVIGLVFLIASILTKGKTD